MTTEFLQRQIERLLAQAAEGLERLDWELVRARAQAVLALQPDNPDARGLLDAVSRATGSTRPRQPSAPGTGVPSGTAPKLSFGWTQRTRTTSGFLAAAEH